MVSDLQQYIIPKTNQKAKKQTKVFEISTEVQSKRGIKVVQKP